MGVGGRGPGGGGDADEGEENGEESEDGLPEESGIVGVHCGAGGARHVVVGLLWK